MPAAFADPWFYLSHHRPYPFCMPDIRIGVIGGTGLDEALQQSKGTRHDVDTPFGKPSDAISETRIDNLPVFTLARHGPGHLLNPSQVPYRANIFALKQLGCTHIIASGAVGGLREEFKPRDLVLPDQIIDRTQKRAGTFFDRAAVHVDFAEPFCPVLRQILLAAAKTLESSAQGPRDFAIHERGCYVCMEGPAFSTRAESLMHRLWGGDLIGMTAMPEAKLAREAEISYAMIALVTDYDCWRRAAPVKQSETDKAEPPAIDSAVLLKEIIANLRAASDNAFRLIAAAVKEIAAHPEELMNSPAQEALKLAIWSDRSRIPQDEVQRLHPLWNKYF